MFSPFWIFGHSVKAKQKKPLIMKRAFQKLLGSLAVMFLTEFRPIALRPWLSPSLPFS
jgi:hypothetical protein